MGHSHLKGLHEEDVEGSKGLFINPGSWMDSSYLVYGGGEFRLERYGVDG
jgi:UDP-2,3-diacylglucosamine pyrophosphatase LpxH